MPEQSIEQRFIALLEKQENEIERTLRLIYGELPAWFPLPRQESARRIIHRLTQDDFSAEQIAEFVTAEMCGNEIFYLLTHPTVARQDINELAHIKYALSLPDNECLEMLAGALAVSGAKSAHAHKKRAKDRDILAFQEAAAPLFAANGYNIAKTLREPALAAYVRKHYGEHTLRDALKKIRPEGMGLKGCPRKGNVTP